MRDRWFALCRRLGKAGNPLALATRLETLYSTPPRAYHNLEHIAACLSILDESRSLANLPDQLEFALWLHDCIYDPRAKDNEARSADVASEMLRDLGSSAHTDNVRSFIMATCHNASNLSGDAALIADIDLSILAAAAASYDAYAAAIRSEYAFVPEDAFRAGRASILRALLARQPLYFHPSLRSRFDALARQNLTREISALEARR